MPTSQLTRENTSEPKKRFSPALSCKERVTTTVVTGGPNRKAKPALNASTPTEKTFLHFAEPWLSWVGNALGWNRYWANAPKNAWADNARRVRQGGPSRARAGRRAYLDAFNPSSPNVAHVRHRTTATLLLRIENSHVALPSTTSASLLAALAIATRAKMAHRNLLGD